jgi:hypothetical protein
VIAAGGSIALLSGNGDSLMAYALPEPADQSTSAPK